MAIRLLEYNRSDFKKWANNDELVNKFLQMRNRLQAPENDMGYWVNPKNGKSPEDLANFLDNYKSKSQQRTDAKAGASNVYEDDEWMCFKIDTYDAAKFYGSGSKWCITGRYPGHEKRGEEYFNSYLQNNYSGYYVVIKKNPTDKENGAKWMVCPHKSNDNKVDIWCQKDYQVSAIPGFFGNIPGLPPLSVMVIDKNGVASANPSTANGGLEYIEFPSKVKAIADKAFYKKGVRTVHLNDGLDKIGAGAFGGNSISKLEIPTSVREIGRLAFIANDMTQLEFTGNNIVEVGERAFAWNNKLTVKGLDRIPLQVIAEDAFDDSDVTFILDPSEVEYLEYAKKIGAKVIDRNGELING